MSLSGVRRWVMGSAVGLVVLAGSACAEVPASTSPGQYASRAEVKSFAAETAKSTGIPLAQIQQWLNAAEYQPSIIAAMNRPAESKTWGEYRPIFLTQKRIDAGVDFWNEHAAALQQAADRYRVDPQIIVAIVGVETFFGQRMGNYRLLDALATLGFDYPKRGAFFRGQLKDLFVLANKEHLDLSEAKGSYAGAMGMPQFIPSSYLAYAVDGNGDGRVDLFHSDADVFASVANYFAEHGWVDHAPVAFEVTLDARQQAAVASQLNTGRDLKPKWTAGALRQLGVTLPKDLFLPDNEKLMLFTLTDGDKVAYWIGLNNFYVITRYNYSVLYAMAVWQLGQAIADARRAQMTTGQRE
ncbi:lytic murein transglycosylase B [Halothiobacillus sp. DCM-1]|uniref:lytic murein transglycosylase B n=1 Tax=Halothiobacillus sp. DCM-1 TaxID=3112558 RepID=UPI003250B4DF